MSSKISEIYEYQLSNNTTQYQNKQSPISSPVTVYDRYSIESSDFFFRNVYSSEISPASSALSAVFVKYDKDADIKNEINTKIRSFDIIGDVIILETKNFFIIDYTVKFFSVIRDIYKYELLFCYLLSLLYLHRKEQYTQVLPQLVFLFF